MVESDAVVDERKADVAVCWLPLAVPLAVALAVVVEPVEVELPDASSSALPIVVESVDPDPDPGDSGPLVDAYSVGRGGCNGL